MLATEGWRKVALPWIEESRDYITRMVMHKPEMSQNLKDHLIGYAAACEDVINQMAAFANREGQVRHMQRAEEDLNEVDTKGSPGVFSRRF